MDATTFKIKTPCLTGRSHTPLARTDFASVGLNYYAPGTKKHASYPSGRGSRIRGPGW